ncbi:MAG TPA: sulfotransferase [Aliidongia sp.]|uniref:sulfotransferase n=1 Tax=Aliidongia sp. TaxID=1914230 RepID=UPI002DDD312E|nr:sulfotransferase [Aliidongia sp.]HEV2674548.1 sulfotransferase [Aliidongia sp.]
MTNGAVPLGDCVPIRIHWKEDGPWIDWCPLGRARFSEPFFDETITQQLRKPFNLLFRPQTPLATLEDWLDHHRPVPPTGFIFHMSRCGSTLVSQMLAASPRNIAISEASPVDAILRPDLGPAGTSDEERVRLLRGVIGAFGQRRAGDERRLFVKFDCWHTLNLALIRRAFPTVPWLFLYRDPVEVLVSQMKQRGVQTVPGMIRPELFGIDFAAAVQMPGPDYCAQVLAALCRAALDHAKAGLLVNYSELPDAFWTRISRHFGTEWAVSERALMAETLTFDSKSPSFAFVPDVVEKQRKAPPAFRAAAERWLGPVYRELEALRLGVDARTQPETRRDAQ